MKRLCAILIPLIVTLAFASVPAISSATVTVKHAKGGAALKEGEAIEGISKNLEFKLSSGGGNLNCEVGTLTGAILKNAAEPATASLTKASFKGKAGTSGTECETSLLGAAEVEALDLPWELSLKSTKSEGTVVGHEGGPIEFKAKATGGSEQECTYSAASVSFKYVKKESPLVLTINEKQTFKKIEHSTLVCPSEGTLSGAFTVTSPGSAEPALEIET